MQSLLRKTSTHRSENVPTPTRSISPKRSERKADDRDRHDRDRYEREKESSRYNKDAIDDDYDPPSPPAYRRNARRDYDEERATGGKYGRNEPDSPPRSRGDAARRNLRDHHSSDSELEKEVVKDKEQAAVHPSRGLVKPTNYSALMQNRSALQVLMLLALGVFLTFFYVKQVADTAKLRSQVQASQHQWEDVLKNAAQVHDRSRDLEKKLEETMAELEVVKRDRDEKVAQAASEMEVLTRDRDEKVSQVQQLAAQSTMLQEVLVNQTKVAQVWHDQAKQLANQLKARTTELTYLETEAKSFEQNLLQVTSLLRTVAAARKTTDLQGPEGQIIEGIASGEAAAANAVAAALDGALSGAAGHLGARARDAALDNAAALTTTESAALAAATSLLATSAGGQAAAGMGQQDSSRGLAEGQATATTITTTDPLLGSAAAGTATHTSMEAANVSSSGAVDSTSQHAAAAGSDAHAETAGAVTHLGGGNAHAETAGATHIGLADTASQNGSATVHPAVLAGHAHISTGLEASATDTTVNATDANAAVPDATAVGSATALGSSSSNVTDTAAAALSGAAALIQSVQASMASELAEDAALVAAGTAAGQAAAAVGATTTTAMQSSTAADAASTAQHNSTAVLSGSAGSTEAVGATGTVHPVQTAGTMGASGAAAPGASRPHNSTADAAAAEDLNMTLAGNDGIEDNAATTPAMAGTSTPHGAATGAGGSGAQHSVTKAPGGLLAITKAGGTLRRRVLRL